jgi:hypothetical protein
VPTLNDHQPYGFKDKLREGEAGERFIAESLSRYGTVHPVASMGFQKVGIDAFLVSERYGYTSMQFKRCEKAQRYGNGFIEVAILDENKQRKDLGWALKTTAQHVAYWAVGMRKILLMDTMGIKRRLPEWQSKYRTGLGASFENGRTWYGEGICVPLMVLIDEVCTDVLTVEEPTR